MGLGFRARDLGPFGARAVAKSSGRCEETGRENKNGRTHAPALYIRFQVPRTIQIVVFGT